MSKRIFIYRHAKSDWSAAYGADHDRPLAPRGTESAKTMGKMLGLSGQVPDLIISSTATRAKETVQISRKEGKWDCELTENEILYYESIHKIFRLIKDLPGNYSSVMLVGHEPKCSALTSYLIGGGDITFKTAAMARIDFETEKWDQLHPGSGELRWLQTPSLYRKGNFNF